MIHLNLSVEDAKQVREAILTTTLPWSSVLDRTTKELMAKITVEEGGLPQ